MELEQEIRRINCEANKKVSFAQKSSIETKLAENDLKLNNNGHIFIISANEIIESALFNRIARDCRGELIRTTKVRRFRKIGAEEWFGIDDKVSKKAWESNFEPVSTTQIIQQLKKEKANIIDSPTINKTKIGNKYSDNKQNKNKNNAITVIAVGVLIFVAFKVYNKNK